MAARLMPQLPALSKQRSATARQRLAHVGNLLAEGLPQWRWHEPDGGSALWVELPDTDASVFAQVVHRLERAWSDLHRHGPLSNAGGPRAI